MRTKLFFLLILALAAGGIASTMALNRKPIAKARTVNSEKARTFQVNGRIREIATSTRTLTVAHDAIPGYMPAMTMPLEVREAALLKGLRAGDEIHFEL